MNLPSKSDLRDLLITCDGRGKEAKSIALEDLLARYDKALEAMRSANSVMDYCAGDKWEREVTKEDRILFSSIYADLIQS